ncbi:MAG: hypothetical protein BGP25_15120 [Lysobacterales bacterium 63-13]|nr:MAG: hypothetical protein BGP25_15120 [Xanthomonadales bacterium 63-13]
MGRIRLETGECGAANYSAVPRAFEVVAAARSSRCRARLLALMSMWRPFIFRCRRERIDTAVRQRPGNGVSFVGRLAAARRAGSDAATVLP